MPSGAFHRDDLDIPQRVNRIRTIHSVERLGFYSFKAYLSTILNLQVWVCFEYNYKIILTDKIYQFSMLADLSRMDLIRSLKYVFTY